MQKIEGRLFNFMLPDELREKLELQAKKTGNTLAETIRINIEVGYETFRVVNALGLIKFMKTAEDWKKQVRDNYELSL